MKKVYYCVEEMNSSSGGLNFDSYEEALDNFEKTLHDLSNYQYTCHRDEVYILSKVEYDEKLDDEEWFTLKKISIKDWKDLKDKDNWLNSKEVLYEN